MFSPHLAFLLEKSTNGSIYLFLFTNDIMLINAVALDFFQVFATKERKT
jgi:hypothetical protein